MEPILDIIQQILTRRLGPDDVKQIVGGLQSKDRNHFLKTVSDILGHVASLLEVSSRLLDNLLFLMVEFSTEMVNAERGTLFLKDSENNELFARMVKGGDVQEIRFPADQGIAGSVFKSGKAIIIPDAYADPLFNQEIDKQTGFRTRNILCAPIRVRPEEEVVGVLELLNRKEGTFSTEDLTLLEAISSQAALALHNAQTFEQIQQAREHESRLLEVTAAISSELQLKPLLQKIMEAVSVILNCDRATLFLHDEKNDQLWSQVALGLGHEIRFPASKGIAGESFTTCQTINIPDAYADPRFNQEIDRKTGYQTKNILTMPIITRNGKRIGVTQVLNKKGGSFTRLDEKKLKTFSAQAAIALENAKLFDEVLNMKNYAESILESLSNGVISVNAMRKIEKCNAVALKTLGVDAPAIVGKYADIFFTGDNHFIVDSLRRVVATAEPDMFIDAEVTKKNGDKISVNLAVAPLRDGKNQPMGGLLVFEDLSSEKRLKGTLARYMTKEVADQLMNSEAALGGKMQEVTILFSDIRSFTSISEKLGAQETVALLNEYFTAMVDIVFHHGGILDKFIGDALLAVFGAPFSTGEDADKAVRTAIDMMRALRLFNAHRMSQQKDPIEIGVGINTDQVLVGNIGSMKRMDYTVIGDGVNLASRLEGANKSYHTGILIAENTFRQLKSRYMHREVDWIRVKGKQKPVIMYEILDHFDIPTFPKMEEVLTHFRDGIGLYRDRKWAEAVGRFERAIKLHPDHLSQVFIDRCTHFQTSPPPPDWDGVWTMTSKS
jgi:adenylate cyclase